MTAIGLRRMLEPGEQTSPRAATNACCRRWCTISAPSRATTRWQYGWLAMMRSSVAARSAYGWTRTLWRSPAAR